MDVIGAGGPLGSRQLLTTRSQAAQTPASPVDRAGQQPANSRNFVRTLQETSAAETVQASTDTSAARAAQRNTRSISAADIQNRENPLPRGSLVNILV